ncbi:MAG: hypothetical protein E6Q97_04835 [Desulfurellales bacterium]|nr:MAG: hypothetical protein E6Q97_04835 [Desulfurellales bacterium]
MTVTEITADLRSTTGVEPTEFVAYFDDADLKTLRKVIREEMDVVAVIAEEVEGRYDECVSRYNELDDYLGATITAIDRMEERVAEEGADKERWGVYGYPWGSRPRWA